MDAEEEDLIPGLPADVALDCLARVPFTHFRSLRLSSPLWDRLLRSTSFHSYRTSRALTRHLIALLHSSDAASRKAPCAASYRLSLFDPASAATWLPVPPPPGHPAGLPLFCRVVPLQLGLAVVGGWDPRTWSATNEILIYDFPSDAWRCGARMPGPRRSFFGCAASASASGSGSGGVVVVAGGHDEGKDALRSAMAYYVDLDRWVPLPDMARERDECGAAVLRGGKCHVIGGYRTEAQGRFERSGEAFDLREWEWGPVEEGFLNTATCPRTCAVGPGGEGVYVCEEGHVAVREDGGWRVVAALPEEVRAALQVVAWEGGVMVLGSGMKCGAQVCYVLEADPKEGRKDGGKLTWRKVEMPAEYSGHIQAACCLQI